MTEPIQSLYEKLFVKTHKKLDRLGKWEKFWLDCSGYTLIYSIDELSKHVDNCFGDDEFIVCPLCEAFGVSRYLQLLKKLRISGALLDELDEEIRSGFTSGRLGNRVFLSTIATTRDSLFQTTVKKLGIPIMDHSPEFTNQLFRERANIEQTQGTILFQFEHDTTTDHLIGYCLTGDPSKDECLIDRQSPLHRALLVITRLDGNYFVKNLLAAGRLIKNNRIKRLNITGQVPLSEVERIDRFLLSAITPFVDHS